MLQGNGGAASFAEHSAIALSRGECAISDVLHDKCSDTISVAHNVDEVCCSACELPKQQG